MQKRDLWISASTFKWDLALNHENRRRCNLENQSHHEFKANWDDFTNCPYLALPAARRCSSTCDPGFPPLGASAAAPFSRIPQTEVGCQVSNVEYALKERLEPCHESLQRLTHALGVEKRSGAEHWGNQTQGRIIRILESESGPILSCEGFAPQNIQKTRIEISVSPKKSMNPRQMPSLPGIRH